MTPVIKAASSVLIHTPGLVRHGSKPAREIAANGSRLESLKKNLRAYGQARSYPPNLVFVGAEKPESLHELDRPWYKHAMRPSEGNPSFGSILDERRFVALLGAADPFRNLSLLDRFWEETAPLLEQTPVCKALCRSTPDLLDERALQEKIAAGHGIPLFAADSERPLAWLADAHAEDGSLGAPVLLENLCAKVSASLAVEEIFARNPHLRKSDVGLLLGCSEEAVGDRYQRGGGNLAKAIAELAGCNAASGFDVKDFCAAPIPALVTAAALVHGGVCENVLVVGGASLPKLGMKFLYHLEKDMPVLEDVQAAVAVWVGEDDGVSPIVNLASVGRHPVSAGAALDQQLKHLVLDPLNRVELEPSAIDKFVTELHNPEITIPANGGDVAERNYRMLGAVLAKAGKIGKAEIPEFVRERGLPGYAPTQGHIASALCYVPHAWRELTGGTYRRCLLFARASLFLGQMTQLSDGMSVLLERHS